MLLHANIVVCMWIHVSEVGGWVGGRYILGALCIDKVA